MPGLLPLTGVHTAPPDLPKSHMPYRPRSSHASLSSILTSSSSLASPLSDESGVPSWRASTNSGFSEEWVVPLTPKQAALSQPLNWGRGDGEHEEDEGDLEKVGMLKLDEGVWLGSHPAQPRAPRTPTRSSGLPPGDFEVCPDDSPTLPAAASPVVSASAPRYPSLRIPPFSGPRGGRERVHLEAQAGERSPHMPPAPVSVSPIPRSQPAPTRTSTSVSLAPPPSGPSHRTSTSTASSSSSSASSHRRQSSISSDTAPSVRSSRSSGSKRSRQSSLVPQGPPVIPGRTTSRRPPAVPGRDSSLSKSEKKSPISVALSQALELDLGEQTFVPSRQAPAPPGFLRRPATTYGANLREHAAPSAPPAGPYQVSRAARSVGSLLRARTPAPLAVIAESPRDIDLSPRGDWSLRPRPDRRHLLHRSRSHPTLSATPPSSSARDQSSVMPLSKLKKSLSAHFGGSESFATTGPGTEAGYLAPPRSAREGSMSSSVDGRGDNTGFFAGMLKREKSKTSLYSLSNASATDARSGLVTPTNASFLDLSAPLKHKSSTPRLDLPFELAPSVSLGADATPRPRSNAKTDSDGVCRSSSISNLADDMTEALQAIWEAERWDWPTPFPRTPRLGANGSLSPSLLGGHQQHPSTFGADQQHALLRQKSQPILPYSGPFVSSDPCPARSQTIPTPYSKYNGQAPVLVIRAEDTPSTPGSTFSSSSESGMTDRGESASSTRERELYTPQSADGRDEPVTPLEPSRTPELVMPMPGAYLPMVKPERKGSLPSGRRVASMRMI